MNQFSCSAWEVLFVVLQAFRIAMLLYAVVSWVPSLRGRWSDYVGMVVEPVLQPVRRVIPPVGGFDLSFLVVIVLLSVVMNSIVGIRYSSCY